MHLSFATEEEVAKIVLEYVQLYGTSADHCLKFTIAREGVSRPKLDILLRKLLEHYKWNFTWDTIRLNRKRYCDIVVLEVDPQRYMKSAAALYSLLLCMQINLLSSP